MPMPEFWLDSNCLIEPKQRYYPFDVVPAFWTFLEQKGREGIIASCALVYTELERIEDELAEWAKRQQANGFFVEPDAGVQSFMDDIQAYMVTRYEEHHIAEFMSGADPWLIAHARVHGGRIVTHEKGKPNAVQPKIPDVADHFGLKPTLDIITLLRELGASFK